MTIPVSLEVVRTIAEREEIDPATLDPPLHDAVDPDALDAVFESTPGADRTDGQIRFEYAGYAVTVFADHSVSVEASDASTREHPPRDDSGDLDPNE
ncbi:HalOD1 output domain-containing protein [Halovivax cerinus]|uniref:HalOD1 output domain-containing protein n=1 Tax=Halovivax cerinus TaxID=1487865 RepID=A0ABD5NQD8_9EURY|nr:HalOD1 output domain-containing protein [Halovivax cerinus]